MKEKKDYYIMSLLIGIGVGSALGFVFQHPIMGVSIGSGVGVFIGGLIENSKNKKEIKP